jgi:hypothetical protein
MIGRNDDWLDRQLREDARRPLEDAGFTSNVISRLPPRRSPYPWLKAGLVLGSTALGGLLAALLAPVGPLFIDGITQLVHMRGGMTPGVSATLAMTVVLVVAGFVLVSED